MDELKPCPFCGGKADTFGRDWGKWWGVECMACQGFVGGLKTPEEARQVWNLRVGDVLDELCDQCYGHLVQGDWTTVDGMKLCSLCADVYLEDKAWGEARRQWLQKIQQLERDNEHYRKRIDRLLQERSRDQWGKSWKPQEELEQEIGRKAIDAMVNIKRALDGVIAYIKVLYPDIDLDQETVKRWAEYRVASGPLWADLETLELRYSPEAMAQITTVALMIQHGYSEPIIAQARQIVLAGMLVEDDYVRGTMAILADGDRVEEPAEECSRLAQAVQAYAEALNGARATIWLREPQAWTGKIKTWTNSQGTPVMQYAIELEE